MPKPRSIIHDSVTYVPGNDEVCDGAAGHVL